ncbi:hypothetical protein ACFWJE_33350 [Streptomyces griseoincarnatus]
MVDWAREIVNGYAPMKVTPRQVMYILASDGTLPHTAPMYVRLSAQLAKTGREGRFLDLIDTVKAIYWSASTLAGSARDPGRRQP